MQEHFSDRLIAAIQAKRTPLVVGLDPRWERLPDVFRQARNDDRKTRASGFQEYCNLIIDAVHDCVPAVKPQAAFFEQLGPHGMVALANVVDHACAKGLTIIMDAKRGDIGSTAQAYAEAYLGPKPASSWGCDCLTVNPYLGADSLEPFVNRAHECGAGLFVLVKTSNPGGGMIQDLTSPDSKPPRSVFEIVADQVQKWSASVVGQNGFGSIGAVVGATHPDQLSELRTRMPNTIFLVPGLGAQGGTAADVAGGFDENGLGAVVNSSRAIIFAYESPEYQNLEWQTAIRQAAMDTADRLADETSAGQLRN